MLGHIAASLPSRAHVLCIDDMRLAAERTSFQMFAPAFDGGAGPSQQHLERPSSVDLWQFIEALYEFFLTRFVCAFSRAATSVPALVDVFWYLDVRLRRGLSFVDNGVLEWWVTCLRDRSCYAVV